MNRSDYKFTDDDQNKILSVSQKYKPNIERALPELEFVCARYLQKSEEVRAGMKSLQAERYRTVSGAVASMTKASICLAAITNDDFWTLQGHLLWPYKQEQLAQLIQEMNQVVEVLRSARTVRGRGRPTDVPNDNFLNSVATICEFHGIPVSYHRNGTVSKLVSAMFSAVGIAKNEPQIKRTLNLRDKFKRLVGDSAAADRIAGGFLLPSRYAAEELAGPVDKGE